MKRIILFLINFHLINSITLLSCNSDAQASDNVNSEAKVKSTVFEIPGTDKGIINSGFNLN